MAGDRCTLTCNVKDPRTNKVKVSTLWEELTKFFKGDRRQAVLHYFLTKDSNFLLENSNILEFDADGEVTISSLKKALDANGEYNNLSSARTRYYLNNELKSGAYNYSEALDNVLKFNKSNQFRDGYMATLKKRDDGKYFIEVVERNPDAEYALADHVMNRLITDAIKLVLNEKGLSVEFLDNPTYAIKYSTDSAHPDADGLMAVASIMDGHLTSKEIAEIAGHFITSAMKDTPLVQRLVAQLTPEVQMALFKNKTSEMYRDEFIVTESSAEEAAGILVGKALVQPFNDAQISKSAKIGRAIIKGIKNWGGIKILLKKIAAAARKLFGNVKPDDVKRMVQNVRDAASTVAQGFLSDPSGANTQAALSKEVTYIGVKTSEQLSKDVKRNIEVYENVLGELKDLMVELKELRRRNEDPLLKDIYKSFEKSLKEVSSGSFSKMSIGLFAKQASVESITELLINVTNCLDTEVRQLLEGIQPSNRVDSYKDIVPNAKNMMAVNTIVKNIALLQELMYSKVQSISTEGNNILKNAIEKLGEVLVGTKETYTNAKGEEETVTGLLGLMEAKRRQVFTDTLRNFWGEDFIELNVGKVWRQGRIINGDAKGIQKPTISDLVTSLDSDISLFDRYFSSAADCGDFCIAVGNKATKMANMQADRLAMRWWDRQEALKLQMQDAFGTTDCRMLYEYIKNEDGGKDLTGNLVSRLHWGAWEAERKKYHKQLKEEFYEELAKKRAKAYKNNKNTPGYVFKLNDLQKSVLWHNFIEHKWEKWNLENSDKDPEYKGKGERWIPKASKYSSEQWNELFEITPGMSESEKTIRRKRQKWFNELMELKKEMDILLPKNSTLTVRAPQITGRFSHRYRNLSAQLGNNRAAFGRAIRSRSQDWTVIREDEAWMFGSNNEFNEIQEDPLENPLFAEREKINRIPIYGINKLKDMNNLSTDLFGTLMNYGSMVATYHAMSQVADIFELGKDQLKKRKLNYRTDTGSAADKFDGGNTRVHARYLKFVEKDVYQIAVKPPKLYRKAVLYKIVNALSSLGGRIFLYGNLHGGVVNTGTGFFEMYKEAMAGENYTIKEFNKALKLYFDGLLETDGIWQTVGNGLLDTQRPMDKNALWIRHWNILSENRSFLRNQKFDTHAMSLLDNRLWEWFDHALMLPYSSGEHFMQCVPYYAMGLHEKVYDRNGNKMNLMDAYEIVDGEEVFAIEKQTGDKPIGNVHRRLKLKEGIFRSAEDIVKYDLVESMLERIDNFFLQHSNAKNADAIGLDMMSNEEQQYLIDEGFYVPENVKQLQSLKSALKLKLGDLVYNQADESAFMDKCRNICNRLHGIYNTEDRVAFQQMWYGNLVMSMRGYALGMINRRFANSKFNVPQRKVVEGSYNTFAKVVLNGFFNNNAINWQASAEALLLMLPFVGGGIMLWGNKLNNRIKADMIRAGFSPHQYYNMRRTAADFLVLECLALVNMLSAPGKHFGLSSDDDEDKNNKIDTEDNWLAGLLYYFSMRWINEQGAFTWPGIMLGEGNNLLDYVPIGASGFLTLLSFLQLGARTGFDYMDGELDLGNKDLYYQTSKHGKYESGDSKLKIKFLRLCPYIRTWYLMRNPYDAATSYEYGRRMRGK